MCTHSKNYGNVAPTWGYRMTPVRSRQGITKGVENVAQTGGYRVSPHRVTRKWTRRITKNDGKRCANWGFRKSGGSRQRITENSGNVAQTVGLECLNNLKRIGNVAQTGGGPHDTCSMSTGDHKKVEVGVRNGCVDDG